MRDETCAFEDLLVAETTCLMPQGPPLYITVIANMKRATQVAGLSKLQACVQAFTAAQHVAIFGQSHTVIHSGAVH